MDVLIALGTTAAWAYSTVVTSPPVSSRSLESTSTPRGHNHPDPGGPLLEHVTKRRASAAIRKLVDLQPTLAHRVDQDGSEVDVPVEQVRRG